MTFRFGVGLNDSFGSRLRFEVLPNRLVVALTVPSQLDGVELDLGDDDGVRLLIVFAAVQTKQGREVEVVDVLERVAELAPLRFHLVGF